MKVIEIKANIDRNEQIYDPGHQIFGKVREKRLTRSDGKGAAALARMPVPWRKRRH